MEMLTCGDCSRSYFKVPHKCPDPASNKRTYSYRQREIVGLALDLLRDQGIAREVPGRRHVWELIDK